MNKLFNKIATITLGLAMAIGVGVAIGGKAARSVKATDGNDSLTYSSLELDNGTVVNGTAYELGDYFEVTITKNSASTAPTYYTSGTAVRCYVTKSTSNGNVITVARNSAGASASAYITRVVYSGTHSKSGTTSFTYSGSPSSSDATSATYSAASQVTTASATLKETGGSKNGQFYCTGVTVYYTYTAPSTTYTVSFLKNNVDCTENNPSDITQASSGAAITLPGDMTAWGYTFGGWNENSSGTGTNHASGSSFTPTSNITLHGKWSYKTLTSINATDSTPTKTSYTSGENFDPSGLVIRATFSGESQDTTVNLADPNKMTWTSPTIGSNSVTGTFTWNNVEKTVTITGLTVTKGYKSGVYYTLDPEEGSNNSYDGNCDVDVYPLTTDIAESYITWNVTGNASILPWRIGGKSKTDVDRTVYSKTSMDSAIGSVDLTVGDASGVTVNSLTLVVASNSDFSTQIDSVSEAFEASSTITFEPTTGLSWASGAYYKFIFNITISATSNKYFRFEDATFNSLEQISATIGGNDSVNSGSQWASTGIEDEDGDAVIGATYSFTAGSGVQITASDTTNGTFTATGSGSVTVGATASNVYDIANKTVNVISSTASVTYNPNGATSGNVPVDSNSPYDLNETVTVLGNSGTLAKTDWTWNGWNTRNDGEGTHYDEDDTFTITQSITLYAEWVKTLDAITSITGTVFGKTTSAGTYNWDFEGITVLGTISGATNQDISEYIDLTSSTAIPSTETESMDVTVIATKKSSVVGDATSLSVTVDGSVSSYINTSGLRPGKYYIKCGSNYFDGTVTTGGVGNSTTTKPTTDESKFTFALVGDDTWTVLSDDGYYLSWIDNTKGLSLSESAYNITVEKGSTTGTYMLHSQSNTRYFALYDTNLDFRCYNSGQSGATFDLTLETAKTVSGFSVYSVGANKQVLKNSTFDASAARAAGFEARLNYTDSTYDDVSDSASWTLDTSTVGTATLTVSYLEYTPVTFNDMVIYSATIDHLVIDSSSAKTTGYYNGDTLNTDNLVIVGVDDEDSEYPIGISEVIFSPTTLNTVGTQIITVTYTNEDESTATGTYSVSVAQFTGYSKVTNVSDITVGDSYLIGGISCTDLMGTYTTSGSGSNTKYFRQIVDGSSVVNGDYTRVLSVPSGAVEITFLSDGNGGYYIYDLTGGKYLQAGSSTATLKNVDDASSATSWSISFDETGIKIGDSEDHYLEYNNSSPRFANYVHNNSNYIALYKKEGSSLKTAATSFANNSLKMNDPAYEGDISTPNCAANYSAMKVAYAALSDEVKSVFQYSSDYSAARARMEKWAIANGESFTYGAATPFASIRHNIFGIAEINKNNTLMVTIIVSAISAAAIGGYFFLRKKKEQ